MEKHTSRNFPLARQVFRDALRKRPHALRAPQVFARANRNRRLRGRAAFRAERQLT